MGSSSGPDAAPLDGAASRAADLGVCRGLARWVRAAVTQPIDPAVPADDAAYLQRKGCLKLAFRTARRRLVYAASGQARHVCERIDPGWQRLLWIHHEAPQLGDMLMDLAPRSLLVEAGHRVDLLTTPALAAALRGDRWLGATYGGADEVAPGRHDAVIASSHVARALRAKQQCASALPWVSLAREYSVPDYQRAVFTSRRLADLLGVALDPAALRRHARQKLSIGSLGKPVAARGCGVVIAVGGVRADRSYGNWAAVVAGLARAGVRRVVLVGSDNGRAAAAAIRAGVPAGCEIDDGVGGGDIAWTQARIARCAVALCADGGLMHLACTTSVPTVALFNDRVAPVWRLPLDFDGEALQSSTSQVSDIAPDAIVRAALRILQRARGPLDCPRTPDEERAGSRAGAGPM